MKKSNTTLWMSVVLVLVGCNSFNHYELKEDPVQNYASKSIWDSFVLPEKKLDGTVAQSEPTCPPFQLPDVPKDRQRKAQRQHGDRRNQHHVHRGVASSQQDGYHHL